MRVLRRFLAALAMSAWAVAALAADPAGEGVQLATALPRYGLVISISDYTSHSKVANARSDGLAMSNTLHELNFNLVRHVVEPRTRDELHHEIDRFRAETLSTGRPALVVAYIAGHGFQSLNTGHAYIMAADAPYDAKETGSLSIHDIAQALVPRDGGVTILLIDACRTPHEFQKDFTPVQKVPELDGVLIVYATKSGSEAQSVSWTRQSQSPFSLALTKYLSAPNKSVQTVMVIVGDQVTADAGQRPSSANETRLSMGEVYLRPADATVARHGRVLNQAFGKAPTKDCLGKFNKLFPANAWTNWAAVAAGIFDKGESCDKLLYENLGG